MLGSANAVTNQVLLVCFLKYSQSVFWWPLCGAGTEAAGFDLGYG